MPDHCHIALAARWPAVLDPIHAIVGPGIAIVGVAKSRANAAEEDDLVGGLLVRQRRRPRGRAVDGELLGPRFAPTVPFPGFSIWSEHHDLAELRSRKPWRWYSNYGLKAKPEETAASRSPRPRSRLRSRHGRPGQREQGRRRKAQRFLWSRRRPATGIVRAVEKRLARVASIRWLWRTPRFRQTRWRSCRRHRVWLPPSAGS